MVYQFFTSLSIFEVYMYPGPPSKNEMKWTGEVPLGYQSGALRTVATPSHTPEVGYEPKGKFTKRGYRDLGHPNKKFSQNHKDFKGQPLP